MKDAALCGFLASFDAVCQEVSVTFPPSSVLQSGPSPAKKPRRKPMPAPANVDAECVLSKLSESLMKMRAGLLSLLEDAAFNAPSAQEQKKTSIEMAAAPTSAE